MKAISRVAAAFLVSASMLAAAQAQQCPPGQYSICGPCDQPCEPYWVGRMGDSQVAGGSASSSPTASVQVADAKPDSPKKSMRDAVKPLNEALQKGRYDARGRPLSDGNKMLQATTSLACAPSCERDPLFSSEDKIRNAVASLRENTSDPVVAFVSPNLSSDPRVNAKIQARIQAHNRLFKQASKDRITLY